MAYQTDAGYEKCIRATELQVVRVRGFRQTLFPVCRETDADNQVPS